MDFKTLKGAGPAFTDKDVLDTINDDKGFFQKLLERSSLTPGEKKVNNSAIADLMAERAIRANNLSSIILGKAPTGVPLTPNLESKKLAVSGAEKLSKTKKQKKELLDLAKGIIDTDTSNSSIGLNTNRGLFQ